VTQAKQVNTPRRTSYWPPFLTLHLLAATYLEKSSSFSHNGQISLVQPAFFEPPSQTYQAHTNARLQMLSQPTYDGREVLLRPSHILPSPRSRLPLHTHAHPNTHNTNGDMSAPDIAPPPHPPTP